MNEYQQGSSRKRRHLRREVEKGTIVRKKHFSKKKLGNN